LKVGCIPGEVVIADNENFNNEINLLIGEPATSIYQILDLQIIEPDPNQYNLRCEVIEYEIVDVVPAEYKYSEKTTRPIAFSENECTE